MDRYPGIHDSKRYIQDGAIPKRIRINQHPRQERKERYRHIDAAIAGTEKLCDNAKESLGTQEGNAGRNARAM
jgi:hypothetical protein